MHRSFSVTLARRAAPVGISVVLLAGAFVVGCGEDPPPGDPSPKGGATSTGGAGSSSVGGSGGGGAGANAGGSGGTAGTAGAGGSAGKAGASGAGGGAGTAGANASGAGGGGSGGAPAGGSAGAGASGGAGAGSGGTAGSSGGGAGGSAGGSGGSGAQGGGGAGTGPCPSDVSGTPTLTGTPMRIASVPPPDSFNMNNGTFGNVEGPVWIDGVLYVSEMSSESYDQQNGDVKKSRILAVTPSGQTSIFIADSGTNGLAVDAAGNLLAANHKDGNISRFTLPGGGAPTPVVGMFMGARFNSPNDLAIHSNGTIYFSDPNFQAPSTRPQSATRVYRLPQAGDVEPIPSAAAPDTFNNPNGVTLSIDEDFLYVAASNGRRYPVMGDGTLGAGENFTAVNGADGLAVDCAGNLYVAVQNQVRVFEPDGTPIDEINVDVQSVTNVAFGGADRKTLYITGLGNNKGLFQLPVDIPGRPY
jgi:gluconolactonase